MNCEETFEFEDKSLEKEIDKIILNVKAVCDSQYEDIYNGMYEDICSRNKDDEDYWRNESLKSLAKKYTENQIKVNENILMARDYWEIADRCLKKLDIHDALYMIKLINNRIKEIVPIVDNSTILDKE